jgi:hypothetical protein
MQHHGPLRPAGATSAAQVRAGWHPREPLYGGLLVVGTALPLSRFLPWLAEHGLDVPRFVGEISANRISAFFGWDVVVSVVTLLALAAVDRDLPGRQRLAVGAASLVGASVGLPLYLLLRERQRRGR